jgi:D-serine deaminase-like pyridoxal phosphate-dependent protein
VIASSPANLLLPEAAPRPMPRLTTIHDLPTPALVLDLDAFESNLKRMADFVADKRVALRPHAKTHKCPIIAHRQMELGAVGICCAKVSEAEVMLRNGLTNILITSPLVTPDKIARVIDLARQSPDVQIVLDHEKNARDFNDAARAAGVRLSVFIDLDPGLHRTGVQPGEPALRLCETIDSLPNLRFGGLQFYEGRLMHRKGFEDRRKASLEAFAKAVETRKLIESKGLEVPVLTGGGTGTYNIDCDVPELDDLQVGSYIFMDAEYRACGGRSGDVYDDFRPALTVLTTAISQPIKSLTTVDAGFKAMAADPKVPAEVKDIGGVMYNFGGDEHGILFQASPTRELRIGDRLQLIVSHCDPTVNLYDHYYAVRGETVEAIWPIAARGCSQ